MARALRRALIVVLITVGVIALFLAIAQDQVTLKVRSAVSAADPRSTAYLAALVTSPVSRGDTFDVLRNGDDIFPAMLSAIHEARQRISFETYIFEDGVVADQFIAALIEARHRNVAVTLVVDFFGGSAMSDRHVDELRAAGCVVASYNSAKWYQLEDLNYRTHRKILELINYRTHRKILVVDGETGFVGGVGIADHWMGNADGPSHWRDTQVRIRGPVVRLLEAAFYENLIEAGDVSTPILNEPHGAVPSPVARGPEEALILRSAASGGSSDLKRLYLLLIAMAQQSVDITTPYFIVDESTLWSLQDAIGRGVRVRILTEGDVTDSRPVKYASRRYYEHLLSLGVELYEYQPTMMHTKALVVDGAWSMFGSANLDNRSLELNDELNVAVRSTDLGKRFTAMFDEDIGRATRLDLQQWSARSINEKARERFWGYWGEVF
jgi:cardiolipin synthase A/B